MITIKNQNEMEKYYIEEMNTYVFNDNVEFKCDIDVDSDIKAYNINAGDIKAYNINAGDINAYNINYFAVCFAYKNIECKSIKGGRFNCKHFCLDGEIKIKSEAKEMTVSEISKQLGYEVKIVKEK